VVAHLAGGVKEAVEIVGIVKGLLVMKQDIHRKSLSFFLSGCLNAVDMGKVLKDTVF